MSALLGVALSLVIAGAAPTSETRWVMGTRLVVDVHHADEAAAARARDAAFQEAQRLDNLLSNYLEYSPLSQLNARAGEGVVPVDMELANYLLRARRDTERTDGAFDVTVGALVGAHRGAAGGAGPAGLTGPDAAATTDPAATLVTALQSVGAGQIEFADIPMTDPPATTRGVALPAGMEIDPGGDGKGVAVDAMAAKLRGEGIQTALINFGESSFLAIGAPDPTGWRIALRGPQDELLGFVKLQDLALSASSALPPSTDAGAPRHGHVVDPRTGVLVSVARTAVVLSPSATDAEVLSTALIVEGRAGARWLSHFEDAHAAVFEPGEAPWMSPGFAERFDATDQ